MDLNPFDISDLTFCVDLMRTLEELPVPNKTMLSKVLLILEHWSHMDPSENKIKKELQENSEVLPQTELSSCRQLVKATAKALLEKWKDLNEAFKIPKKFTITKDHNEKDPLVELNETKPEPQKERHNR